MDEEWDEIRALRRAIDRAVAKRIHKTSFGTIVIDDMVPRDHIVVAVDGKEVFRIINVATP